MKAVVFCAAFATFAVAPVFAEETLVARQGDDSVRLSDAACKSELVIARLPGKADEYRAASAVFQGQRFQACWRMVGGAAHLIYEDGDQGIIPATELKPELTA